MRARRTWTVAILCLTGLILGTLGTWSVPLGHGTSAFWPALVVQVAGGIWFGGWGVLAGVLFPIFTNAIAGVGPVGIFGYMPANLLQAAIPAWAFRHYGMDAAIPGRKGLVFYFLWGALIPAAAGALMGALAVVLDGIFMGTSMGWGEFPALVLKWWIPHTIVSSLIGIPAVRVFTPLWRDLGVLVQGWWDLDSPDPAPRKSHSFEHQPIHLKLIVAMSASGILPLMILAAIQMARGSDAAPGKLTSLALTVSLVLSILAMGFLSAQVIRPLRELKESVETLMHNPGRTLNITRDDEIGQVGRTFELLLQQRQRAEQELRESEERYRSLANNYLMPVIVTTEQGDVLFSNQNASDFFGFDPAAPKNMHDFWPDPSQRDSIIVTLKEKREIRGEELTLMNSRNELRTVLGSTAVVNFAGRRAFLSVFSDITDRKRAEEALQASLEEKVVLLKEVHHRVKNNLQIVSSLLSLQSSRMQTPEALEALNETSNRIRSMSLLHETLYHSGNLARVDFRAYIQVICSHLMRSWSSKASHISLEQDLAAVNVELDQAVPCGLIVNELVSNAMKHAFPGNRSGRIFIGLKETPNQYIELTVSDDGVGVPAERDAKPTRSLGFQLIAGLVRQLRGELAETHENGTTFILTFDKRANQHDTLD